MRAVALATTYSANGRGSDIASATWNLYQLHSFSKVWGFDWRTRGVWFVEDYSNKYVSHSFLFALLLMTGEAQDDYKDHPGANHWILPRLKELANNSSAKKISTGFRTNFKEFRISSS